MSRAKADEQHGRVAALLARKPRAAPPLYFVVSSAAGRNAGTPKNVPCHASRSQRGAVTGRPLNLVRATSTFVLAKCSDGEKSRLARALIGRGAVVRRAGARIPAGRFGEGAAKRVADYKAPACRAIPARAFRIKRHAILASPSGNDGQETRTRRGERGRSSRNPSYLALRVRDW